jgi:hypothetical protein
MSHTPNVLGATEYRQPGEARNAGLRYPTSVECILCGSVDPKAEILAIQHGLCRVIACFMINLGSDDCNAAHEQGLLTTQSCPLPEVDSSFWVEADIRPVPTIQQRRL